jgi:hypothetical protein
MKSRFSYAPDMPSTGSGTNKDKAGQDGTLADESLTAGDLDGGGGVGGGIAGKESQTGGGNEAEQVEDKDDELGPITES